ncbi:PucR family transcriptional regulator [Streptomyces tsukubensis]|uniref:PucR family transcriptional regulator n=1 Tax=Streptomyces tsukubensis TaxID=83656 RepID=UPI00098EA715|nr:helix-turn-helix domain-containing protein [Streptomyces tsukubensis]QFR97086.1 PucR family transcriptional regulator [Streptomyces tsukubensis]
MQYEMPTAWPVRRSMPDLNDLDASARAAVAAAVDRLRVLRDVFADRVLTLICRHVPGYAVLPDEEIRSSARKFMDILVAELSSLRVPDEALREMLVDLAVERAAQGLPLDVLTVGHRLGSRVMLSLLDEVAAEVGLPPDFLLAVHDSTWEFSNEAAAVFARVQHDLALERARFDSERRSAFAAGVLGGTFPVERINRDARLFGLVPQGRHVALAAQVTSTADGEALRRSVASALCVPTDRLLLAQVGTVLGIIAPKAPESVVGHLVAAGPPLPLERLDTGFGEAVLALETARRFAMSGIVCLSGLGPRPLVLSDSPTADGLSARHLRRLDVAGRSSGEIEQTARVYLECDQDVREVAKRLAVHPNTVRYRVSRFQELTGLNLRHTEDVVTSWWLLNRRRV